jgi:hypothetical protein
MVEINKAHFDLDGDSLRLTMPIAKVDEERRIVSGFATLDNVDRQGDVLLTEASRKAFENFRGNVRLMHQPIPAGKVISFRENSFYDKESGKTYTGIFVDAYISKGAENIWQMVLDGTLTGFSIGGRIVDYENKVDDGDEDSVRIVKEYELMELSLVDSPANQFANIFSIQKVDDEFITSGIATEVSTENVYWCESDKIAIADGADRTDCPSCRKPMHEIGWVESNDVNKNQEIGKIVDLYLTKAESLQVGNFVSWNSSGGTARGKVERISRTGSINVPGSDFTINAEEGDPAVLIRVYRKGADGWEPTDTRVGHKMSTLRRIDSLGKSEDVEKETVTSENTPSRNAEQGLPGAVSASVTQTSMTPKKAYGKKKKTYKADSGDIESGSFVAYADGKLLVKGKVENIVDNIAEIRVYQNHQDSFRSTNNFVYKSVEELTKLKVVSVNKVIPDDIKKGLEDLADQHNQKYGNVSSKRVDFQTLLKVFNRGIESYRNNPVSSKNPNHSEEEWAIARVKGFLHALKAGKFKRKPYDTDLLPTENPLSTKKSLETLQKNEGGVEMADNETSHEELDTAQAVDETSEEVEFEVEETIEDVVNEALAMAKSDVVEAEQAESEDTSSEVFDMEKALGEVKSFVEDALTKSAETSIESLDKVTTAVLELAKAVDEKVGQLQAKYEEVTKSLADLSNAATEIASRVESVEEETAIKKSGELENSIPEQPIMKKSVWGGRFLSSADVFN